MNKLRRILSVFAAFGILLSLTGCIRLAQEDGDLNGQDRFIGRDACAKNKTIQNTASAPKNKTNPFLFIKPPELS
jgi:hypothetical protein